MRSDDKNNNEACNGSNWNDTEECALAAPRWMAKRLEQGERGRLYLASRYELHDALLRTAGEQALGKWPEPFSGYCANVEANLLKDVPFSDLREAFDNGKGQELHGKGQCPPKMAAVYSSSALVLNTFGPWHKDPSELAINGHTGFHTMKFEAQLTHGLRGTRPHLDLCLESDKEVLAIESKCLEYLDAKPAKFSTAYDTIVDHRAKSPWFRHIAMLRKNNRRYKYLDAAQLIKHYLGLSHSRPKQSITLLYLFWEPSNWQDFETFRRHREEIDAFTQVVGGDRVRFQAMSYNDLWADWEQRSSPSLLVDYVRRLKHRYEVRIRC